MSTTEIFYAIGLIPIALVFGFNRHLFAPGGKAGGTSGLEVVHHSIAVAAIRERQQRWNRAA